MIRVVFLILTYVGFRPECKKLFTRGRGRGGLRRLEIFLSFNIGTRLGCVRDGCMHRAALMRSGCKRELACYLTKKDATDSGT